jgi:type I restriction enzyme M protein
MPKLSLAKLERHLYRAADRLRQEGLDAATYKDYIFGMLFLKRCSDVWQGEHDVLVARKVADGVSLEDAETNYGENPDFYDSFFVPATARWSYLQDKLNDGTVSFGSVLDIALSALTEHNESLEHVLDHIQFLRVQSNKRIVSDDACKDLVRIFSRYRLRNEDFQFSDLLGSAYEFLINMFAESAGKKGGDFYTPRDVIRLIVRLLHPTQGMSVYDPTCGSGGMLIISREYIEQSGGDPSNLRLAGQVSDPSAWSICKLNMLLHGVPGADIQLEDTLLHPQHREAGELERFDRVIANPPFSQNYTRTNMEFPERFQWGWCPTTGKKGDLMFAQHMLAVCRPDGMVATVMPHGVLFRGGDEKKIRTKFLKQDLIEAVISLPPNLFYGAGIPACILVMRPNLSGKSLNPNKPEGRRGKVLFINADAEFYAGRAQNYLRPEHIEKIASIFERFDEVPSYSRCVPMTELKDEANDYNLNIRRYVDNSPPPEPHDVRAHLLGGIPITEVKSQHLLLKAVGFDPAKLFDTRDNSATYFDFASSVVERGTIRTIVENDPGVQARLHTLANTLSAWWKEYSFRLAELPEQRNLNEVRRKILESFVAAFSPLGHLDRFKLAGVIASWWTETLPDFKTLLENGFPGVVDGWVDAIADALEDDDAVGPTFDPFGHKLVRRIMVDYMERIAKARSEVTRLKAEKESFELSNPPEDADEEEIKRWNYSKDLERQIRELKVEYKDEFKKLTKLEKAATKRKASDRDRAAALEAKNMLQPTIDELEKLGAELLPYQQIKQSLALARSHFKELTDAFIEELKGRCAALTELECRELVLGLLAEDVLSSLEAAFKEKLGVLVRFIEGLWDKYRTTLSDFQRQRDELEKLLSPVWSDLGYV